MNHCTAPAHEGHIVFFYESTATWGLLLLQYADTPISKVEVKLGFIRANQFAIPFGGTPQVYTNVLCASISSCWSNSPHHNLDVDCHRLRCCFAVLKQISWLIHWFLTWFSCLIEAEWSSNVLIRENSFLWLLSSFIHEIELFCHCSQFVWTFD